MVAPKNLALFDTKELSNFLNSFDDVLCDCDGVVFILFKPIEGAFKSLIRLRNLGKTIRFVSNNCTQTLNNFVTILNDCGFEVKRDDIVLPTVVIISYLKAINFNKKLFVVGLDNFKSEFIEAGFILADNGPRYLNERIELLLAEIEDNLDVGAVIFDWDLNLNYIQLQKVLTYLKRPEVHFIIASSSKYLPIGDNTSLIGCGYFQTIITNLSGRVPITFGKPSRYLNAYISKCYKLIPERTLLIGDLFSDMVFAANAGYQTLMVLTGSVTQDDLSSDTKNVLPKYYLNSLAELHTLIDKL